jgi:hypothetical protein
MCPYALCSYGLQGSRKLRIPRSLPRCCGTLHDSPPVHTMPRSHLRTFCASLFFTICACAGPITFAQALERKKSVVLHDGASERVTIGTVTFTPGAHGNTAFKLALDADKFGEHFLAMRPFKCLAGARQHLCHFPLEKVGNAITAGDAQPLEYALMFMHKKPAKLSLDSRDGLYYALTRTASGFAGRAYDVDMEPIIVPDSIPAAQRDRPIAQRDLHKGDTSAYWLPYITIE